MIRFLLLALLTTLSGAAELEHLPVLHEGRLKPFAVAAEETVLALTGKTPFGTVDPTTRQITGKRPSQVLLLAWMLDPAEWHARPLVQVPWHASQRALGIPGQWASLAELEAQRALLMDAADREQHGRQSGEVVAWSRDDEALLTVARRQASAIEVLAGRTLGLAPLAADAAMRQWVLTSVAPVLPREEHGTIERMWRSQLHEVMRVAKDGQDDALLRADPWLTLEDVALRPDPVLLALAATSAIPAPLAELLTAGGAWAADLHARRNADASTARLAAACRALGDARDATLTGQGLHNPQGTYPASWRLGLELAYYQARPFTWAWLLFTAGAIALAFRQRPWLRRWGVGLTAVACLVTVAGLAARHTITGLGAVTNLYETMIYVALISAVLGLWLSRTFSNGLYAVAGNLGAAFCAMIGEAMPPELGSSIGQLQPVLRSRFWLWLHVKVVVASYAPFVLAWVLGNVALWQAWRRGSAVSAEQGRALYRCLQIGTVLIAAGTLLGAVWADEAWGRFWGWDPKEVGALLVLLTYLVPLHLRYVGAVGHTGLAAWSVLGALSVLWSWYGVNFIQATGLHAYAFGSASRLDQLIVGSAVAVQVALTSWQLWAIRRARTAG
jgi:ABC-type transport system involved in cytochrome c biogenesis permease subunit